MPSNAPSRKSKAPDKRPARERYWRTGQLRKHKVHNMMRSNPHLSKDQATKLWESVRKRRMKHCSF